MRRVRVCHIAGRQYPSSSALSQGNLGKAGSSRLVVEIARPRRQYDAASPGDSIPVPRQEEESSVRVTGNFPSQRLSAAPGSSRLEQGQTQQHERGPSKWSCVVPYSHLPCPPLLAAMASGPLGKPPTPRPATVMKARCVCSVLVERLLIAGGRAGAVRAGVWTTEHSISSPAARDSA